LRIRSELIEFRILLFDFLKERQPWTLLSTS